MSANTRLTVNKSIAVFDSDCLEVANKKSVRSKILPDFGFRERIQPIAEKLDKLYAFAEDNNIVMVFTHCCGAANIKPDNNSKVLVVPMDSSDQSWLEKVDDYRLFNIEKRHDGELHESFICRHFDAFQHNPNAALLIKKLNIPTWVVFGHGFDLCVDSSVKGIISSGYKVHLLTDMIASSASGYGPYGTEESKKSILEYLIKVGVTTGTIKDFLQTPNFG